MLITIGLTILGITAILAGLFYLMYHTFHGDLPGIMKLVVAIFLIAAAAFIIIGVIL